MDLPVLPGRNNLIAYTDLTTLEPAREDRALVLLGLQSIVFGEQRLAFGSAQVLGNEFIGAGHSALVEFSRISDTVDYRHEKVIYSNNHCLHANGEPSQDRATVRLWGSDLIVTGNHVKAGPRYFSMAFNGRTDVALIANVTTGGFTQLGSAVPMPPGNFNVQI